MQFQTFLEGLTIEPKQISPQAHTMNHYHTGKQQHNIHTNVGYSAAYVIKLWEERYSRKMIWAQILPSSRKHCLDPSAQKNDLCTCVSETDR